MVYLLLAGWLSGCRRADPRVGCSLSGHRCSLYHPKSYPIWPKVGAEEAIFEPIKVKVWVATWRVMGWLGAVSPRSSWLPVTSAPTCEWNDNWTALEPPQRFESKGEAGMEKNKLNGNGWVNFQFFFYLSRNIVYITAKIIIVKIAGTECVVTVCVCVWSSGLNTTNTVSLLSSSH